MVFVKGHKKIEGSGMQVGQKIRPTLLREERRAKFDSEISQVFEEKIHAARPEYVLDQYLGKTPDLHLVVNAEVVPSNDLKELADALLHQQTTS
jgi:hypothetical protein